LVAIPTLRLKQRILREGGRRCLRLLWRNQIGSMIFEAACQGVAVMDDASLRQRLKVA